MDCGDDGCGDVCGTCAPDEVCNSGQCLAPGECQGECGQFQFCEDGECVDGWLDPGTGYIWENPFQSAGYDWEEALARCFDLDFGGHTDWHLPTVGEALTILTDAKDPATNCYWAEGLWGQCSWGYWTSSWSENISPTVFPWRVDYGNGSYDHVYSVTANQYVRCVRNTGCDPQCDGLECGDDGCGGYCGACESGHECQTGECVQVSCQNNCGQISANSDCDCDFQCWQNGTCCDDVCDYCGDLYAAECN